MNGENGARSHPFSSPTSVRHLRLTPTLSRTSPLSISGMGPYITEPHTPVAAVWEAAHPPATRGAHMRAMVDLTTRMNALARITLGNVNIAATTALQAVHPTGRELALRRGANILMPILTPAAYRADYALYEGKPCITDTAAGCEACLKARVAGVGLRVEGGVAGDPPHATGAARADVVVGERKGGAGGPSTAGRGLHTAAVCRSSSTSARGLRTEAAPGGRGAVATGGRGFQTCARVEVPPSWTARHPHTAAGLAAPSSSTRNLHTAVGGRGAAPSARPGRGLAGGGGFQASARAAAPHSLTRRLHTPPSPSSPVRTNIAFVGAMNAGKSSALCALAPGVAIVDPTPGTTADVKVALAELHGVGPVKLMDTAGVDETGVLGAKKRRASLAALGEADVVVVVIDPSSAAKRLTSSSSALEERALVDAAVAAGATPLLLFNTRQGGEEPAAILSIRHALDPDHALPSVSINLASPTAPTAVADALKSALAAHGGPAVPPPS